MDVERAVDRLPRNLDLVLVIDVGWVDTAVAIGAVFGQRRFVNFVDPLGHGAMGLGAVIVAGLAPGFFGLGLGGALAKGGAWRLPRPGLFERAGETFNLGFKFGNAAEQRRAAGAGGLVHAARIARKRAQLRGWGRATRPEALTNYWLFCWQTQSINSWHKIVWSLNGTSRPRRDPSF